ncbi:restin-like protein [Labeo rohita]|uniref:Restin-like protein n=1 Tax=Labeo rohita TaxID=84645 RepID=A0A498M868_LABRO|nr:restin-like protein [Labeo rohita]
MPCLHVLRLAVTQWSPTFVQDLLPAAQKTALLYHLSYLCLANFPNLERIIRSRAVETQLLFGSSDATMLKCILTSENLVQSLFPMLTKAVEKNKPVLAVKFLAKAQVWIKEIITEVDRIVEKYDLHNKDVASSTSDVVKEKIETDKKITQQDHEMKQTENTLNDLKSKLQKATKELAELERKINSKSQEIQDFAKSITKTRKGFGIFAAVVPFVGLIVKSIYDAVHDPENVARMKALEAELNNLIADKTALKQKQWQLELQIIDWQMKFAKANFDRNSIPDPIHLNEVQSSLSKIQAILIQLKNFWENVAQMLKYLEQKTFVGEDLIEDLVELKDEFLESIKAAEEAWSCFGAGCKKASVIFKIQAKDAYKFLEVSPSSLSKEQWQTEYESVKEQLQKIDPVQSVTSSNTPAISE